jgi:hypothetical protein
MLIIKRDPRYIQFYLGRFDQGDVGCEWGNWYFNKWDYPRVFDYVRNIPIC